MEEKQQRDLQGVEKGLEFPYPIIKRDVPEAYIEWAKEETAKFDKEKSWNKLKCDTNWIGILGERLFSDLLMEAGVNHKWSDFLQPNMTTPDFYLFLDRELRIDVKTTWEGGDLWIPEKVGDYFDYLVLISLTKDYKEAYIMGYATRRQAKVCQNIVENQGKKFRVLNKKRLKPLRGLIQ